MLPFMLLPRFPAEGVGQIKGVSSPLTNWVKDLHSLRVCLSQRSGLEVDLPTSNKANIPHRCAPLPRSIFRL